MPKHFMSNSPFRILLLATILLACVAAPASAATSAQIHRDAADGSIDGSYTLAEMRAADRDVSAEQREYFGWDDVYRDHVRQLAMPAPAPARRPSRDSAPGSSASLMPESRRTTSSDKSPKRFERPSAVGVAGTNSDGPRGSSGARSDQQAADDELITAAGAEADRVRRSRSADGSLPMVWLIAAIPLGILTAGVWRMRRVRRREVADRAAAWQ